VVADHWPLLRLGLSRALANLDVRVVGESDDATAAIRVARHERASLLILGQLRGLTQVEAVRVAKADPDGPRILVMMGAAAPDELSALLAAGADGLIDRMAGPDDVAAAVEQLLAGDRCVAPTLLPALIGRVGPPAPQGDAPADGSVLTDKERQVLAFLARGGTNVEIARALYITPATVKTHVSHIYAKLGVKSRNAAVTRALELGLLT
jgi:DNA-binding NarL/FixJ family response regulator